MVLSLRTLIVGLLLLAGSLRAQLDSSHPWNPATPLPQFITHDYIDPVNLNAISKYRSNAGHVFSDNYEPPNRSMKNYFEPRARFRNTKDLPVFSPADATIGSMVPEGHVLSNGEIRGMQLSLQPDGFPMFEIRLFHVSPAPGIAAGVHVKAGDPLGFADIREAIDVDMAVAAAWNATPLFGVDGQGPPGKAPGYRYLSPFDVMDDATFAHYAPFGAKDRNDFVVSLEYRAAHPVQFFGGVDLSNFSTAEYFVIPHSPAILWYTPSPAYVAPPDKVTFTVTATPDGAPLSYQWFKDGNAVPGATDFVLTVPVPDANGSQTGFYWATVTATGSAATASSVSETAVLTVFNGSVSRLVNVSTRGLAPAGGALTPGFILSGGGTKNLLVRAVGPTLASFGLSGTLADPKLEIIPQGQSRAVLTANQWTPNAALLAATAVSGAFALTTNSKDAAVMFSVPPDGGQAYSVRISPSAASSSGIALAEIYDPEPLTSPVRLKNLSTLGYAGVGAETFSAGFVIGGTATRSLLIRAVGPGLAQFGVTGRLEDPRLTVIPAGRSFVAARSDNFGEQNIYGANAQVFDFAGAFPLPAGSKDAALFIRLPAGGYTVQVTGANDTTGLVLLEIYDVGP